MATRRKVRGFKQSELVLPDGDVLPYRETISEPSRATLMTPRSPTMRNMRSYARNEWAPKPLRGWLALRQAAGWFGIGRTWVPYWCAFDSRYLLLYAKKPGSQESPNATGYSVTTLDPSQARATISAAPKGIFSNEIPLPTIMIDLSRSTVEAKFEDGQLYAFIHRPSYPDYVMCGNHLKHWIHEWQKINTTWTDENGAMFDVPTDVVDKLGNVMEPRMDMSERFFLRQQGAFLMYMAGPLQFEAWNSRLGDKWFLHFVTFDAYDPVPKISIFGEARDSEDNTPPKIVDLTGATISEHLDPRQRAQMKIEIPGKPPIVCDGPNIQWWLGALQWATRDKGKNKSMFRDLIKHRRFVPVEKSISVLRMRRRMTEINFKRKGDTKRQTITDAAELDEIEGNSPNDEKEAREAVKPDWKFKSDLHTTGEALSSGPRLSAAEFARNAGRSPPRRARRSSAPKPDKDAMLRAEIRNSRQEMFPQRAQRSDSRAQIPLISLGLTETGDVSTSPRAAADDSQLAPPRRKSDRKTSRSKSPRADSPLTESTAPTNSKRKSLAIPDDTPSGAHESSKRKSLAHITEDDFAASQKSPNSLPPLSPISDDNDIEPARSPRKKSAKDFTPLEDDIPDEILTPKSISTPLQALED